MKRWLGCCGAFVLAIAAGGAHAQAIVRQRGDAIVFSGRIDQASVREFLLLLPGPSVRRLVIRSQGGLVEPALDMAEALFGRGLDVEVDQSCLSSCANYVFPAGRHKLLSGPFAVGWHGNMAHVLYREARGDEHWSEPMMASARVLARREAAFYARIGVDGFVCWFGKLPPYGVPDFYALSVTDMAGFGIRDVTVRAPVGAPPSPDVRSIAVDWGTLERIRPPALLPR